MGKKRRHSEFLGEEPPEGCFHYTSSEELHYDHQKYFAQRYSIFSKYDKGIWMTEEAWFGVTPEPVAKQIAHGIEAASHEEGLILVDAFAGVGGNVIEFARRGHFKKIYAIEKDPAALKCAKHNAEIYGVAEQIEWVTGDCFEWLLELYGTDDEICIFASPPWGGPSYRSADIFDLSVMEPYSLDKMMRAFRKVTRNIVLYLPRTSDVTQLVKWQEGRLPITHYCMRGASKALCAYFGPLFEKHGNENH